jgi:hypothetical protein
MVNIYVISPVNHLYTALDAPVNMAMRRAAARRIPLLSKLRIADAATPFAAAGFAVVDERLDIGGVAIDLVGRGRQHSWEWKDGGGADVLEGTRDLDGISTHVEGFNIVGQSLNHTRAAPHPNLAQAVYSISVATPDLRRTMGALSESLGEARRVLDPTPFAPKLSMALFKLGSPSGPVIVEVLAPSVTGTAVEIPGIGSIAEGEDVPASIVGMVVLTPHLEHLSGVLGAGRLGKIRPAMQGQGRRIAPVLRGDADARDGLALGLAFMTPPDPSALQQASKRGPGKGLSSVLSTNGG